MFVPDLPVSGLRPARYNPRRIDGDTLAALRESLRTLGYVKPVVTTSEGLIIAGHQRTEAALAEGIATCPAYVLQIVSEADEVRFNQLHNGCEIDITQEPQHVSPGLPGEWKECKPQECNGPLGAERNAAQRQEMLRLLAKYGPFSSCVATESGEVIAGAQYCACCRILRIPVMVRYVAESEKPFVRAFLGREYGRYSYDHLPRTTWAQSLAQMARLKGKAQFGSSLYERTVIPRLEGGMRLLDFGAGTMAYVERLRSEGHDVIGLEFYRRKGFGIDVRQVHRDIDHLFAEIRERGRFDAVVCDSVLNSVDSVQSEIDVLLTVSALCRPGGWIFLSGRSREKLDARGNMSNLRDSRRYVEFLDEGGFTAIYRQGVWQYQRYHAVDEVREIGRRHIGPEFSVVNGERGNPAGDKFTATSWHLVGRKVIEPSHDEWEPAVAREFDLPLPKGRYGRGQEAVTALTAAIAREGSSHR